MTQANTLRALLLCTTALLMPAAGGALAQAPGAQPQGGRVVAGQASISQSASQTTGATRRCGSSSPMPAAGR